jgi:hypothetical protein
MSLLIINLMMTALKRSDNAIGFRPQSPAPDNATGLAAAEAAR